MAITISGENNNDRILAQDGVIDSISGFNIAGIITASSFTGDLTGDVTGNLSGNVTGNINNTTLLLQTGGSERVRIASNGKVGVGVNPQNYPGIFVVSGDALICDRDIHSRVANSVDNSERGFKQDIDGNEKLHLYADNSSNIILEGNGGSEIFRIDSSGNVGIDETGTVLGKLHVVGGRASGTAYNAAVFAGGQNSTSGSGVKLYLSGCENDPISRGVILESIMTNNANAHRFSILVSGSSAAPTEKFRIDSSGRVLIGTTTEGHNNSDDLTIATSGHTGITLRSGTSNNGSVFFSDGTSGADEYRGWVQYTHTSNYLTFGTNASERLRIDSNGRVLIGHDSTPTAALSVAIVGSYGASSSITPFVYLCRDEDATSIAANESLGQILFASRDGYRGAVIEGAAGGTWSGSSSDGYLVFKTTPENATVPTERLRIASSGNVSIGTQNVTQGVLQVNGDVTAGYHHGGGMYGMLAKRKFDGTNAMGGYAIRYASGYESPWIVGYNAGASYDNQITFGSMTTSDRSLETGVQKRMVIDMASGFVGIGTADPQNLLHIEHSLPAIRLTDSANSQYAYIDGNSGNLILHSDKGNTGSSSTLKLAVDNNVKVTINQDGKTEIAGNLQFTAANPELEFNNGGPRFRVPAANTLTVHTGGTIGSTNNEVIRIDSGGNFKQGTSTPSAFTGSAPNNTQRFLGKKCMQGSVTSTTTLDSNGDGTFDLGRLWITDDSSVELFIHVCRNDSATYTTTYAKGFIQKVRGTGMSQGHILYQRSATSGFSLSNLSSGGYTGGSSAHGTQIDCSGGAGGVIYRMVCFYTTISKNDMY